MTRRSDTVIRFGGEEFVILMPHTTADNAYKLIERIRYAFENLEPLHNHKHFSASFGVTQFEAEDTADMLIKRADAALYQAKKQGRNQSVTLLRPT